MDGGDPLAMQKTPRRQISIGSCSRGANGERTFDVDFGQ
jgi:hypothetical protein